MNRRRARIGVLGCLTVLSAAGGWAGCARTGGQGNAGSGGRDGGSGGRGGGGAAGSLGTGGQVPTGAGGGAIDASTLADRPVLNADALGDAACLTHSEMAKVVPLDLYVMLDSSGSMIGTTSGGQTKWDAVRAALTTFLRDPQSAGLGVGIQYFPLLRPNVPDVCENNGQCNNFGPCDIVRTCSGSAQVVPCGNNADCAGLGTCVRLGVCGVSDSYCAPAGTGLACSATAGDQCLAIPGYCNGRDVCEAAPYATPAVPVGTLPGAANALVDSLTQHQIDGLTPTAGALAGAVQHGQALARANPTHKVAVLLATDGLPSVCTPTDIAGVAALAASGYAGTPSVPTYVIGVFTPEEQAEAQANLNTLAAAGGTGQAFIINTNQNVTQSFLSALNTVRSSGLSCQYTLPAAMQDGGQVDYFSVNVQFTSGTGAPVTIGNVPNRASCSATQGGWYYDVDPATGATPRTINICERSCGQLRTDPNGTVQILLGCTTIIVVE